MISRRTLGLLGALLSFATIVSGEELKITHDWPGYNGPDGTFADQSRVPLLDDFSRANLFWISEHEDLGHAKTSSGGGHCYGSKSKPSGSCDLIVAGGLVIAGYFTPKNNVAADDIILALDAATGKTKWKQVYAGQGYTRTARKHVMYGTVPAAAEGKVFHLGSGGKIYCVELATGKPLWESDLGDYPEFYKKAVAKVPVVAEFKDGVSGALGRPLYNPLVVIGGVLLVTADNLYAYDTATGKELWKLEGVIRVPSPAKIGDTEYVFCSGNQKTRLVEPKTGKVLWTEKFGTSIGPSSYSDVVADGRAFVPYPKAGSKDASLAAFSLSTTGAKLLWQSQDPLFESCYYAYRDGVIYANGSDLHKGGIKAFRAEDGTVLGQMVIDGHFHLWGDRLVMVGDDCHESIGHACTYQSLSVGMKDWKLTGHPLTPRNIRSYYGVAGYMERWMRPTFADGLIFTRSVNQANGKGSILCWDLRARPNSTVVKFQIAEPMQGHPKAQNLVTAEAEIEAGKLTRICMTLPMRSPNAQVFEPIYVQGTPQEATPLVAGRWKGKVDLELVRDAETWLFDLDTSAATPSGTYQRTIAALAQPTDVEGTADAKEDVLANSTKQWVINLSKAACPVADTPSTKRRENMYIVVTQSATGARESFARARTMNTATHEVRLATFESGEKSLTVKGTVLFHSDKYVNPSNQRIGTVAMDMDITLTGEGGTWKGTYKGHYGSAWTGGGKIGAATSPAESAK